MRYGIFALWMSLLYIGLLIVEPYEKWLGIIDVYSRTVHLLDMDQSHGRPVHTYCAALTHGFVLHIYEPRIYFEAGAQTCAALWSILNDVVYKESTHQTLIQEINFDTVPLTVNHCPELGLRPRLHPYTQAPT